MAKNKIGLMFEGFDETIQRLKELEGDLKTTTEDALKASQAIIAENAKVAIEKHVRSGKTKTSVITDGAVEWEGFTASIPVGFDIKNGGLPSVFLMYGTPRMAKDPDVYNAVYGKKTRERVQQTQRFIFADEISKMMRG